MHLHGSRRRLHFRTLAGACCVLLGRCYEHEQTLTLLIHMLELGLGLLNQHEQTLALLVQVLELGIGLQREDGGLLARSGRLGSLVNAAAFVRARPTASLCPRAASCRK